MQREAIMEARDVMVFPVITVAPTATIQEVAQLFVERNISGAPVVDDNGRVIGIVSEGDLLHRSEAGTHRTRSWWLRLLTGRDTLAADYVKEHGSRVADVMSRDVVSAEPSTPLREIARLLEANRIKRVPVLENGRLVGLVSRANVVQAIASSAGIRAVDSSDSAIRDELMAHIKEQPWADLGLINITVSDGVVGLWGIVDSDVAKRALRIAAERIHGVKRVEDHLMMRPFGAT
jgi:CBS domain-containing protein